MIDLVERRSNRNPHPSSIVQDRARKRAEVANDLVHRRSMRSTGAARDRHRLPCRGQEDAVPTHQTASAPFQPILYRPLYGPDALTAMADGLISEALTPLIAADEGGPGVKSTGCGRRCPSDTPVRPVSPSTACGPATGVGRGEHDLRTGSRRRVPCEFPMAARTSLCLSSPPPRSRWESWRRRIQARQAIRSPFGGRADRPYPMVDIRVDEHAEPIPELRRIHILFVETRILYLSTMATRENPR